MTPTLIVTEMVSITNKIRAVLDLWVESGDNWEPLIRDDQNEEEMTDKELKKVESTPESRCKDARRCRLAALGATLRNRDYDKNEEDDQEPLERALMAVMSTPSLVGPLKPKEKEFYVTWFSLAYRSGSPRLGFGENKTPVVSESFCVHQADVVSSLSSVHGLSLERPRLRKRLDSLSLLLMSQMIS